jgi:hypothetical protein
MNFSDFFFGRELTLKNCTEKGSGSEEDIGVGREEVKVAEGSIFNKRFNTIPTI